MLAALAGAVVWMWFGKGNRVTDFILLVFAVCAVGAIVQRWRGKIRLGFGVRGAAPVREFLAGFAICLFAMAALFLAEWALGAIRVQGMSPDVGALLSKLGFFAQDAALQEVVFRTLMLGGMLALTRRPWLAVGLSSLLFGLMHMTGEGASALSVLGNTLDGVLYGAPLIITGRIWMPIGLHAAWNWAQGPVFGFPVSGVGEYSDLLVHQVSVGDHLLTGGAYGPEGGVVALAIRLVAIVTMVLIARRFRGVPEGTPSRAGKVERLEAC